MALNDAICIMYETKIYEDNKINNWYKDIFYDIFNKFNIFSSNGNEILFKDLKPYGYDILDNLLILIEFTEDKNEMILTIKKLNLYEKNIPKEIKFKNIIKILIINDNKYIYINNKKSNLKDFKSLLRNSKLYIPNIDMNKFNIYKFKNEENKLYQLFNLYLKILNKKYIENYLTIKNYISELKEIEYDDLNLENYKNILNYYNENIINEEPNFILKLTNTFVINEIFSEFKENFNLIYVPYCNYGELLLPLITSDYQFKLYLSENNEFKFKILSLFVKNYFENYKLINHDSEEINFKDKKFDYIILNNDKELEFHFNLLKINGVIVVISNFKKKFTKSIKENDNMEIIKTVKNKKYSLIFIKKVEKRNILTFKAYKDDKFEILNIDDNSWLYFPKDISILKDLNIIDFQKFFYKLQIENLKLRLFDCIDSTNFNLNDIIKKIKIKSFEEFDYSKLKKVKLNEIMKNIVKPIKHKLNEINENGIYPLISHNKICGYLNTFDYENLITITKIKDINLIYNNYKFNITENIMICKILDENLDLSFNIPFISYQLNNKYKNKFNVNDFGSVEIYIYN